MGKKEISRDQLADHLRKLGIDDPEFIIDDLIIGLECQERGKIRKRIEKALDSGDMEVALDAAIEILDKFGKKRDSEKGIVCRTKGVELSR